MRSDRPTLRQAGQPVLAALALLTASPAAAAIATSTMAVSAQVEQSCNLDVRPLRFDGVRSGAPVADARSEMAVGCTPETAFVVTMDGGQNQAVGGRRMAAADGGFLAYELYSDAARTRRWGASLAEAVSGQATGGGAIMLPIYGRIDSGPVNAGAYSDVVTVTVNF